MTRHPLLARYEALVAGGALERDPAQLAALARLEALALRLSEPERGGVGARLRALLPGGAREAPRGLYIHGLVGRGKTTLMDIFFDAVAVERKRRVHFHAFMAEVHGRLLRARRAGDIDPLTRAARDIAQEARVLCFDEFAVTDIADATILSRLFTALLTQGVIMVATSNVEPSRLYEGGRNRDQFLPFVALIEARLDIVRLDARADFRMEKPALAEVYFTPADEAARATIDALFAEIADGARGAPMRLRVGARDLDVPLAANGVARFDFADLCARPLGAADYFTLAESFDTVIVENVPAMTLEKRNEAKRFITLVDILYEKKTRLIVSAETDAPALYAAPTGHEAQEFVRTASRLVEMRSAAYLEDRALQTSISPA